MANRCVTLSTYDKDIRLFYVYFCFKTFFICLCIVFFSSLSLKGVLLYILPIRVVLQPSFKLWMNVCVYVCVSVCDHHWKCYRFWFSACCWVWLGSMYLFTVMTWRCLIVLFFSFFFFECVCVAFLFYFLPSRHWLVGFVLYGCWPCLDLMLPNPIPTEPLKIF